MSRNKCVILKKSSAEKDRLAHQKCATFEIVCTHIIPADLLLRQTEQVERKATTVCQCCVCVDLVQQGLVSSSKPAPAILANDVVGPLLLEVSLYDVSSALAL